MPYSTVNATLPSPFCKIGHAATLPFFLFFFFFFFFPFRRTSLRCGRSAFFPRSFDTTFWLMNIKGRGPSFPFSPFFLPDHDRSADAPFSPPPTSTSWIRNKPFLGIPFFFFFLLIDLAKNFLFFFFPPPEGYLAVLPRCSSFFFFFQMCRTRMFFSSFSLLGRAEHQRNKQVVFFFPKPQPLEFFHLPFFFRKFLWSNSFLFFFFSGRHVKDCFFSATTLSDALGRGFPFFRLARHADEDFF